MRAIANFLKQLPGKDLADWDEAFCKKFDEVVATVESIETRLLEATEELAKLRATPPAATGFVMVPKEPTMGMWDDFCAAHERPTSFDGFQVAYKAMCAAAPQSGKKEEWISVSERLPDFEERVLVYRPGPYSGISMSWRSAALSDSYYGWLVPTATHWMPLPSPPASKAEGTK